MTDPVWTDEEYIQARRDLLRDGCGSKAERFAKKMRRHSHPGVRAIAEAILLEVAKKRQPVQS